jgi:curved DNA-binding protein CbpA
MAKSYFAILGIAPLASADDIRSAYRRLAKEYHTYSKMTMP